MDVLSEQLEILTGSWGEAPFSFSGRHYTLEDLRAEPRPVQRPHPPLIIGGTAGPRSAALAARFADEYNTVFATVAEVRERRARLADACHAAGRDELPLSIMTAVIVGRDDAELRERVAARARRMATDADVLVAAPPSGWIVGTLDAAAEQLRALAAAGVTRVMCQHYDHTDLEMVSLIGEELAPLVYRSGRLARG
jgi:alkanesulfonate monooxygenase SsuD/methylene tetrahydromethanopterin reductase-like flavin-dependent oxidoreductase (luciferase family)